MNFRLLIPRVLAVVGLAVCLAAPDAWAKGGSKPSTSSSSSHRSTYAPGVKRDANGRIARSPQAKESFMKSSGHPNGRPGYVVDHVVPLKRGGADSPSSMRWQTKADAKANDETE